MMKKLITVASLAAVLLAGCGQEEKQSKAANVPQQVTTNLGGEPYTLDPAFASDSTSFWVIGHLYEGLYKYDEKGTIVEGAAKKIDVSQDGKQYTFTLRDNLKWSNGDKVTAQDFEYAWERVLNPKTAAYNPSSLYIIKGAEEYNTGKGTLDDVAITTAGDNVIKIELDYPVSYFPKIAIGEAYLPVDKDTVEKNKNWAAEAKTLVGNGAYSLKTWKHNELISITKNKNYWDNEHVKLNDVNFKMVADGTTAYQMYKSGELDLITSVPIDAIAQEKKGKELVQLPSFSIYTYTYNVKEKPFNNVNIRQALSYAIDREAIANNVAKGGEIPAYGYVPYGVKTVNGKDFRDEVKPYYSYDVEKAKQLLAQGLKEEGLTTLPAVTFKYSTADNHKKIAEAIQEMLKQNLGVEVKLENQEWKTYIDTFKQKNFQAARMGWGGDYVDPLGMLPLYQTTSSSNFTNWSNKQYDALIEQAKVEQDEKKRLQYLHDAEGILMKELPIIPIYFSAQNNLVSPKLKGVHFNVASSLDFRYVERIAE